MPLPRKRLLDCSCRPFSIFGPVGDVLQKLDVFMLSCTCSNKQFSPYCFSFLLLLLFLLCVSLSLSLSLSPCWSLFSFAMLWLLGMNLPQSGQVRGTPSVQQQPSFEFQPPPPPNELNLPQKPTETVSAMPPPPGPPQTEAMPPPPAQLKTAMENISSKQAPTNFGDRSKWKAVSSVSPIVKANEKGWLVCDFVCFLPLHFSTA